MEKYIIIGVIVVVVLMLASFVISTYNKLVKLRNSVKDQWSQIDIQLKRRFDLIPNLVETVKGYAKHEEDTLKEVIEARNSYQSATTHEAALSADTDLTKSISKLFALTEAYPELKANQNFVSLQTELSETEDKISYARQFYSDSVLKYNNEVQMFPGSIVASLFGFKEEKYFEAAGAERENVKVDFSEKK
ncbi:MAG: LemA family protein [Bacilli bacterium]|nr:LemA family protein [Bacilli bacterium]